jgi:hypothetical protein
LAPIGLCPVTKLPDALAPIGLCPVTKLPDALPTISAERSRAVPIIFLEKNSKDVEKERLQCIQSKRQISDINRRVINLSAHSSRNDETHINAEPSSTILDTQPKLGKRSFLSAALLLPSNSVQSIEQLNLVKNLPKSISKISSSSVCGSLLPSISIAMSSLEINPDKKSVH